MEACCYKTPSARSTRRLVTDGLVLISARPSYASLEFTREVLNLVKRRGYSKRTRQFARWGLVYIDRCGSTSCDDLPQIVGVLKALLNVLPR